MCSFGSCQTRFEFLSQFRKVRNAFECFVTQVQTHLPKTKRVWPMKINVICTVYIMNGWNHQCPKGSEIRCSGKSEHFLPHMWHPSQFTQYVTRKCQMYEDNPCFNNFETRIDPPNRKSLYFEQTRASRTNCETKAPYAGDSGILLLKHKQIIGKSVITLVIESM